MRKQSIKGKIQIASYDDLLSGGVDHSKNDITDMPLINLHEFKNHPFHVVDDERMQELVESIKEKGVLSPAIVRKREKGGYEIISGHRRRRACELAGLLSMPVIIKDLDDDEATILMVDANIQRENILPSERAFAYKMRMDAEGRQGKRTKSDDKITSRQVVEKLTSDRIGEDSGISGRQVNRYIRLTNLIPELLEKVDSGKIGFVPAVNISSIDKAGQKWILRVLEESNKKITLRQSELLKKEAADGALTEETVVTILVGKDAITRTVTLSEGDLKQYFPESMEAGEIKEIIKELLEKWSENR
ncbi:MAG: ParB/RepB/Spo0J family partition protein [Lachnospiraceae bacterium]|nr:ParB/RepB/Spo0J family partition protein [Lachnospiraceae bacterium]